jgi:ubiquinone/menaquinone biosynthesis C-methylase UbiE
MKKESVNAQLFSGSIPANYDEYLGPMFFEPYAQDISKLISTADINAALEIGCGTGRVTRHLRNALAADVKLIASDISPDMLAVAKNKLKNENIEWKIADAQKLPFDDNSVDLVVCYFGYMLVPDKGAAYSEAKRVLRKGGMFLMATWDKLEHNEASFVFRRRLKDHFGESLPELYKLPFSMHDSNLIIQSLKAAGFIDIQSEHVTKHSRAETAAKAAHGLVKGGSLYHEIMKRDPKLVDEIFSEVEKELTEKYGREPMIAPMSAIITIARK